MEAAVIVQIIASVGSVIGVGLPLVVRARKDREEHSKKLIDEVSSTVELLRGEIEGNTRLTVSSARAQLESIYNKHKSKKTMPQSSWKAVCELHAAYKGVVVDGHVPNHWADELYHEMEAWKKV